MPNTLLAFTSLLPFSGSFVLEKKKNYNTLLFLTFIKAGFCYFWRKKKMLGTGESLVPFGVGSDSGFPLIPGVRTAELVPLARAAPLCTLHWQVPWSPPCCEEGSL